jgi:hypothetical protein
MNRILIKLVPLTMFACLLTACAFKDAQTAKTAQRALIGWSELDLETCLGAPDQRTTLGDTDILTYYGNSTSNKSFSLGLPFLGGFNLAGGGYCHAIFRVKDGRVAELRYNGETNATLAPDAYCAPIVRGCVQRPEHLGALATLPTPEAAPGAISTSQQDEYDLSLRTRSRALFQIASFKADTAGTRRIAELDYRGNVHRGRN